MSSLNRFRSFAHNLFHRDRLDRELNEEIRGYADLLEEEEMSTGMNSTEARRNARIEMGGPDQIKEEVRNARAGAWLEALWRDLHFGARMLRKNPGFTATAILTLALGIGANTAIFSVVHAVLLSSLPYRQPDRLVQVWGALTNEGIPRNQLSDPEWFELVDTNQSFEQAAAFYPNNGANLGSDEAAPQRVTRGLASSNFFSVLGVEPILGRTYSADEDQPGHSQVAVISYDLWRSLFAGDLNAAGKTIRLNARPFIVIGVLPSGFQFGGGMQVWTPLALDRNHPNPRGNHSWQVIARLKPGTSLAQASADMDRFANQIARENPDFYRPDMGWGVYIVPLREELVGQIRPALLILSAAVGIVLLIACANIANLLLARSSAREKEMAIRASLGAGRWRTIRQLLTESVLLSLFGGVLGLALGGWGMVVIRGLQSSILPHIGEVKLDSSVLLFTLGIAVLTGILFGLAPAIHVSTPQLQDTLKEGGRGGSGGPGGQRLRSALVIAEIALSVLVVAGAGLLVKSFYRLLRVDPGFQTDHVLTLRMNLPAATYPAGTPEIQFFRNVLDRVRTLPGVSSAGAISQLPMGSYYSSGSTSIEDSNSQALTHDPSTPFGYLETDYRFITPGYFETMHTRLVSGRLFSDADTSSSPCVAIVDSKLARDVWPGQNPLQRRISINVVPNTNPPQPQWCTVVGLVEHVHNYGLDSEGRVQAYFPETQDPFDEARGMFVVIRTPFEPTSIAAAAREQVLAVDPREPVYAVRTMTDLVSSTLDQPRLSLDLLGLFAALAVLLAAIGIYGVMTFAVNQRNHELGIRMALGAQPRDIWRMVIGQGARTAAFGLVLGLAGAFYLARYMAPLLFGVTSRDPITFAVVPLLLMVVAFAACWVPAHRATRVDPIVTLRHE